MTLTPTPRVATPMDTNEAQAGPTERLDRSQPDLREFDATVVDVESLENGGIVVLARSAFYPESGGQMADHGRLGEAAVVDVQIDERGIVRHRVEGRLPRLGERVACRVDDGRRRAHMALHTGQHLLSAILLRDANVETVAVRLGETECTVDTDGLVDEATLTRVLDAVHRVIDADVPVTVAEVAADDAAHLPLRRPPKVSGSLRVVTIAGVDVSPCGGTHCEHTSQIQLVHVTGIAKRRAGVRISFEAGPRARALLENKAAILGALASRFTCSHRDVGEAVARLERDANLARKTLDDAYERLADDRIAALTARVDRVIVEIFEGVPRPALKRIAEALVARDDRLVVLASRTAEGTHLVARRGLRATEDCGRTLRELAATLRGKAGGRPEAAEGSAPHDADLRHLATLISRSWPGRATPL